MNLAAAKLQREWRRQLERAEEMARASIAAEQKIIAEKEAQLRTMTQQHQEQQVCCDSPDEEVRKAVKPGTE